MSRATLHNAFRGFGEIALSLTGFVALWQFITMLEIFNLELVPGPRDVWLAAGELYQSGLMISDLTASLSRAAVGFCGGATLGVLFGLLTARTNFFRVALGPIFGLLRPVPAIAIVPMAIVWFGIGETSKYVVIAYTVFLSVWLNTHYGTQHVAQTYIRASRSLGASRFREFFEVVIPAAAPHIVTGLRMGAALAFLSLVAAELTGASSGVGYRLQESRQFLRADRMFVSLIELGILGALLDGLFSFVGRRLIHWEQS